MRQTNAGIRRCNPMNMRVMLCMLLLLFSSMTAVMADVSGVTLAATFPGATGNIINGGGSVSLSASWTGDSPPYTAKFKKGSTTIVSDPALTGTTSMVSIPASQIGDTGGTAEKLTVEIVDSAGKSGTAVADNGVIVDFIRPTLTAQITNGSVFANSQTVRIQVTSNEPVKSPKVTANGVDATMEGSLTQGTSFVYNLKLTPETFSNGNYNVSISANDLSSPEASANTGNTSVSFTVGTSATGNTQINSSTPASPTNSTTISLSGACPSGAASIEVQDNGATASTISVTGTTWSIGLSPEEGTHSYVAISKDVNGTEISRSAAFSVIIDKSAPTKPDPEEAGIPSNTNQASISIPVKVEGIDTEVAKPVQIQALVNGVPKGSPQAVSASPVNVSVPLENGLNRITFRLSDGAGNTSDTSDPINVTRDSSSTSTSTIVTFEAPFAMPIPVANTYQLGGGSYKLKMIFSKDMDSTTNPTITVTTAGGVKITSAAGTWAASGTYLGDFNIPTNGGSSYDGAATLGISGAKDTFGNLLDAITVPSGGGTAFFIDSTPATAGFNETGPIYISSSTPTIALSGQVSDNSSGVGYINLVWQSVTGGAVGSQSVPIMATSPSPWNYTWNASSLAEGKHNLWVIAADQAKPNPNIESYTSKTPRTVIVDRDGPVVTRISIGNMSTDINSMPQPVVIASEVTRLTATVSDTGNSGLAFTDAGFVFSLIHDSSAASILGNKSNNGIDTVYFDFPALTLPGTYTITVTPKDVSGNTGTTATRSFALEKDAPSAVTFSPGDQSIANSTHPTLAINQVWAMINHPRPDYTNSTISVRYNGAVAGNQLPNASTTALVWQLHSGALAKDQSHDGRYDMSVVPKTTLGNTGAAVNGFFTYDSVPPVVTGSNPVVDLSGTASGPFFGLSQTELSITVSDAPRDIITYGPKMPASYGLANAQVPGDPNWYNSAGSGVNITNSSFTWKLGATTSGAFVANGNTLTLSAPPVPADTGNGLASVEVGAILVDRSYNTSQVPNTLSASYTLRFDYLAPRVTKISKPNGEKYCKNAVSFEGNVQDNGSSDEVKVSSVEWADESGAWSTLSASNLPAKFATVTASLNIAGKADGTYSIKVRAKDLGGNTSPEESATYIVDRTPPAAPTSVLPLPDQVTNKRGQSFKWSATTDADHYLLQVADDASFNNVLNTQTNTGYESLLGQVLVMTEGAFT
ncbi:MAG: Ig-like domain-containing protein, partial [Candidatus Riflebacteria bacterium]|nr:Ig-like domain-containing protein [Candidatus Riflebacteria bacterium]